MLEHPTYNTVQCSKKAKRFEQPRPHALTSRVRPEAMLCLARQMLSSAYSPQARRPLDLRPKQRCVQGAEDPPIKRHSSIANHAILRLGVTDIRAKRLLLHWLPS